MDYLSSQNVLAAVFTAMFGAKDPDQVNTMAKQAGEVCNHAVFLKHFLTLDLKLADYDVFLGNKNGIFVIWHGL